MENEGKIIYDKDILTLNYLKNNSIFKVNELPEPATVDNNNLVFDKETDSFYCCNNNNNLYFWKRVHSIFKQVNNLNEISKISNQILYFTDVTGWFLKDKILESEPFFFISNSSEVVITDTALIYNETSYPFSPSTSYLALINDLLNNNKIIQSSFIDATCGVYGLGQLDSIKNFEHKRQVKYYHNPTERINEFLLFNKIDSQITT